MQIPILQGVYGKPGPDFERSYPMNLMPVAEDTSISKGYLRSAPGATSLGNGRGADGGGWVFDGTHYRVSGGELVSVGSSGAMASIGNIAGTGLARFAQSFDRLAVARANLLYYLHNGVLAQVTDPDLGAVLDVTWIDGYFVTTDGTNLVLTELNDPTAVDPVKYGSSEADPDPVVGVGQLRGELVAFNRTTIEYFFNAGTSGFAFQRNRGAQVDKGLVGVHAKCRYLNTYAFVGNGRNEKPRIYLLAEGSAVPLSSQTVDRALGALDEDALSQIVLEAREGGGVQELYVHLPDVTYVYSRLVSEALEMPVWYRLTSGTDGLAPYRVRNFVLAYDRWFCADLEGFGLGYLDEGTDLQFGDAAAWQFDAALVYSEGRGAICHNLELVGFYGRAAPGEDPRAFMSWTDDGLTFSQERSARLGFTGQRRLRVAWRRNGMFRQWRAYRFRGVTGSLVGFSRLEALMEGLNG